MAENNKKSHMLWVDEKTGKIIRSQKNGKLIDCWVCPCCTPKVIASQITNARTGPKEWDLRPYQGENMGIPGAKWRLRDVGESHYNNPQANCTGVKYHEGWIDEKGVLVGLPDKFVSTYSYNGYMQIQQGCVQEDGSIKWPCPNG